eukprot:COSAG02_NODE_6685_length_3420_cov_15.602529_3_plen_74_part_00
MDGAELPEFGLNMNCVAIATKAAEDVLTLKALSARLPSLSDPALGCVRSLRVIGPHFSRWRLLADREHVALMK